MLYICSLLSLHRLGMIALLARSIFTNVLSLTYESKMRNSNKDVDCYFATYPLVILSEDIERLRLSSTEYLQMNR
jgi:hypothetical protein